MAKRVKTCAVEDLSQQKRNMSEALKITYEKHKKDKEEDKLRKE